MDDFSAQYYCLRIYSTKNKILLVNCQWGIMGRISCRVKWFQEPVLIHSFPSLQNAVPPTIANSKDEAEELTALLDTSLNIECAATGTPPPQLHWLKNGLPLSVSSQIKLLSAGQILRLVFFSFNWLTFCSFLQYQHNSAVFLEARVKFGPNHAIIKAMCSMYSIYSLL